MSDPLIDELRARIERRRKLRIGGASQEEVDADWHDVPFPPPPRRQIRWSAWDWGWWLTIAVVAAWLVFAMMWAGARMVDAVLAIQWPV